MSNEPAPPSDSRRFDAAYYKRFYRNPRTRANDPAGARRLAAFIAAYAAHLEVPVRRFVDVGCGTGDLLRALAKQLPRAKGEGVEVSDWACQRYGWIQASAADFVRANRYDLVVCSDVLQYLNDADADKALRNLRNSSRALLYIGARTAKDMYENADRSRSDMQGYFRSVGWYRRRLARDYVALGGGLFARRELEVPPWELEHPR